jgi:hypothetical protein
MPNLDITPVRCVGCPDRQAFSLYISGKADFLFLLQQHVPLALLDPTARDRRPSTRAPGH